MKISNPEVYIDNPILYTRGRTYYLSKAFTTTAYIGKAHHNYTKRSATDTTENVLSVPTPETAQQKVL